MININIQRFGHTNSTPNYNLPQFIGTDKPQWLTDINQAFSAIDTAIKAVDSLASLANTNIGDLTELTTTDKSDLVSAINEVKSGVNSLNSSVGSHTTAIEDLQNNVGDLSDLDTVDKTNLVSAINEVDLVSGNNATNIGNLSNLSTTAKNNLVSAINEIVNELPDVYESQEHITNKIWIDGKPVYRKVISGNVAGGNQWYSIDVSSLNIDHLEDLHMKLLALNNEEQYFNNFYISEVYRACVRYNKANNTIQYNIGTGYATGSTFNITIEYTKN